MEIKSRTGSVLYSSETAKTVRQIVEEAVKAGADLTGAYLAGAYLRGAVLTGAAYGVASMERPPILVNGLRWPVMIFDSHIKIGCELHTISEWIAFSDEEISKMDKEALDFWAQWKETLCAVAVADGRS